MKSTHDSYKSNKLLSQAGFTRSEEGFLQLAPSLTGQYNYLTDGQPPASQAVNGIKTIKDNASIGLNKQFTTGTSIKFEYQNQYTDITNPNPAIVQHQKFWYVKPTLSIEQPLLRNWLGKETKALINATNAKAKADGYLNSFNNKKLLTEAESAYWDLATIRKNINIKKESIKRAKNFYDWTSNRVKSGLSNDSDEIQAQSSVLQKEFELTTLVNQQNLAARLFNAFIGKQTNQLPEKFESFDNINLTKLNKDIDVITTNTKNKISTQIREDLQAVYQQAVGLQNKATLNQQALKPNLNLSMRYFPSGRDESYNHTASEAWRTKHNTFFIGLNFTMPLDISLIKNLTDAYKAESYAAKLQFSRKKFDVLYEWQQLIEQYHLYLRQLDIALQIEKTQHKKLDLETTRHKNGQSTTFQVIQFEQDYLMAQSQYLDIKNKLLKISALIKLFN